MIQARKVRKVCKAHKVLQVPKVPKVHRATVVRGDSRASLARKVPRVRQVLKGPRAIPVPKATQGRRATLGPRVRPVPRVCPALRAWALRGLRGPQALLAGLPGLQVRQALPGLQVRPMDLQDQLAQMVRPELPASGVPLGNKDPRVSVLQVSQARLVRPALPVRQGPKALVFFIIPSCWAPMILTIIHRHRAGRTHWLV